MPELYEQNAFWVDDVDDFVMDAVEEEAFVIDEADVAVDESFIVEESVADDYVEDHAQLVPGSDAVFDDSPPKKEDKVKDWTNDGDHSQFVQYLMEKKKNIPRHTGETVPGCERAKAYLKSLDSEISKAMRTDLKGVIDEQQIDAIRKEIDDMIDRLDRQIKKLRGTKRAAYDVKLYAEGHCDKCNTEAPMWQDTANSKLVCMHCEAEKSRPETLEKTATTPVLNVYMSPFERAIVGTMINSKVSAGKNIEETYERLKNKYNFTPREELAIQQLVADYGYPFYKDRGLLNEPSDPAAGDGVDWMTNYQA